MIIALSSILIIVGVIGLVILSKGSDSDNQQQNSKTEAVSENQPNLTTTQATPEDEELMRFVEKNSIEYKNAISFQGKEYDQYFIANMIHYSEGLAQLEEKAASSTNSSLALGASDRAKESLDDAQMYKQLQKDLNQPASYGNQMQYHAAMGADSEVFYAMRSLDGLTGVEFETKLAEQLKYFRRAETLLSGAGFNNASDPRVKELIVKTLENNAIILENL